jgi:hypothetical protein
MMQLMEQKAALPSPRPMNELKSIKVQPHRTMLMTIADEVILELKKKC